MHMNRAAKAITTAAVGLAFLAISPKFVFSQRKPAPDPIQKEITGFLKYNKCAKTLRCGDTLKVSDALPFGVKKITLRPIKSKNVRTAGKGEKSMVICDKGEPGYFSGRLQFEHLGCILNKNISFVFYQRDGPTTFAFSHLFKDFVEIPLPAKPNISKSIKTPNRSFFGASSILENSEGVGIGLSYSFNVPYVDVMAIKHWKLNKTNNWAFNVVFEFSVSTRQVIDGNFHQYQNIPAISKDVVAARNFTISPYPVFEFGNATCSALFGPKITLFHRSGNIKPVTIYTNGFRTEGDSHSYSFWKATAGIYMGIKVNVGKHLSFTLDYDPSYAFMIAGRRIERPDMQEDGLLNLGNIGINVVYRFRMIK